MGNGEYVVQVPGSREFLRFRVCQHGLVEHPYAELGLVVYFTADRGFADPDAVEDIFNALAEGVEGARGVNLNLTNDKEQELCPPDASWRLVLEEDYRNYDLAAMHADLWANAVCEFLEGPVARRKALAFVGPPRQHLQLADAMAVSSAGSSTTDNQS